MPDWRTSQLFLVCLTVVLSVGMVVGLIGYMVYRETTDNPAYLQQQNAEYQACSHLEHPDAQTLCIALLNVKK